MKRALIASVLGLSGFVFSGCAVRPAYVVGPPPPAPVEYYGVAPGPGYYWTPGSYAYVGHRYQWRKGYWARRDYRR